MRPEPLILKAGPDDTGRRLDRILRAALPRLALSAIYRMLRDGRVRINGRRADGSLRLSEGDEIAVELLEGATAGKAESVERRGGRPDGPSLDPRAPLYADRTEAEAAAAAFARALILETPDLAVIDKPSGVLAHGPGGVDEWALAYYAGRVGSSLAFKPAPLHRLDRNTSGALAVSASARGAAAFSEALRSGRIGKAYLALLDGVVVGQAEWEDRLSRDGATRTSSVSGEGPLAITRVSPLLSGRGKTLALVRIGTGRTHQIRAQASAHGHPLAGDLKYGGSRSSEGYVLHCRSLDIPAGIAGAGPVTAVARLPPAARLAVDAALGAGAADEAESALDSPALRRYPT